MSASIKKAQNIKQKLVLVPATEAVDTSSPSAPAPAIATSAKKKEETPIIDAKDMEEYKSLEKQAEIETKIQADAATVAEQGKGRGRGFFNKGKPHKSNKELQGDFDDLVATYFNNEPYKSSKTEVDELEVRFGTKGVKPISKIDYDNVIQKLRTFGFTPLSDAGEYLLRMQNTVIDPNTGRFKKSNVRVELTGLHNIQKYCETSSIAGISYYFKLYFKQDIVSGGEYLKSVDFDDFNFRLAYKKEKYISNSGKAGLELLNSWDNSKKEFRYINRVTLIHPDFPIRVDMSIVKSSDKNANGFGLKMTDNIRDSGVLTNPEHYEIELEVDNTRMGKTPFIERGREKLLQTALRKVIKYVLCGLQGTNYPVAYSEQNDIINRYILMLHKAPLERRVNSRDFIGPSPQTLQLKNIVPLNKNAISQNIRTGYVVTEKADGDRHMLFVSHNGKIYLINSSMKVIFTGAFTTEKELYDTLIDGELILHNKSNEFINLFAAFDIYYLKGEDVRANYFMPESARDLLVKSRYYLLTSAIDALNPQSVVEGDLKSPIRIIYKQFYPKKSSESIFQACNTVLTNAKEGLFEYTTDGLIFTPIGFGVGAYEKGKASKLERVTWEAAFKWKPPEYNTIDFLVTTKKTAGGEDIVSTMFQDGVETNYDYSTTNDYKTLVLECGISEKNDIYLNPCQDVIDDKVPEFIEDSRFSSAYKHMQFYPTMPYDAEAGICNISLKYDQTGEKQMFTKEGEVFNNNMIVEFSYDLESNKPNSWKWTPLRVRYDKTNELRNGMKNYGNDYRTANSNWSSIHNPITEDMLMYDKDIPEAVYDEDVYYTEASKQTTTRGLRDFHNLFVKKSLITSVSRNGDTLIDFACGKGGDLPKWITANLSFVFGVDVFKDNLENILNGACARYLNSRKQFKTIPHALFVHGNSSENIRSGQAMFNEKGSEITRAVFGQGDKKSERLGKGVVRQFAKGADGFNISSCQFAIHYFCESPQTFYNFMRNVAECTKIGGYFIGTSYDGNTLFNRLKNVAFNDSIVINSPGLTGTKVLEIVKEYTADSLENDSSCLGQRISVFQESIGKLIPEFLVNYDFLTRTLADYGFKLISKAEAKSMGVPNSTGLFSELFSSMQQEVVRDPNKLTEYKEAINMTPHEKTISFLNRYFIYKKVTNVNAEKLTTILLNKDASEYVNEAAETTALISEAKNIENPLPLAQDDDANPNGKLVVKEKKVAKPRVKKLKNTLLINDADPDAQPDAEAIANAKEIEVPKEPETKPKAKPKQKVKLVIQDE